MSLLHLILNGLQDIHGIEGTITPDTYARFLVPADLSSELKSTPENCLVIQEADDEVYLGVKFDGEARELAQGSEKNLRPAHLVSRDFAVVVEELSHLLYAHFHLARNSSLTQLEMEVQAEIDRYLLLCRLSQERAFDLTPQDLFSFLFQKPQFHNAIENNLNLLDRYREAYRLARHACHVFVRALPQQPDSVRELGRSIYRLTGHQKLDHIEKLKAA